jgi:hypothetical protein
MSEVATKLREEDLLAAFSASAKTAAPEPTSAAQREASANRDDANGGALLSADDFAAALAEIENNGTVAAKPQAPPRPGRSTAVDEPPERPAAAVPSTPQTIEPPSAAEQPTVAEQPPAETPRSAPTPVDPAGIRPSAEAPPPATATTPPPTPTASEAAAAAVAAKGLKFTIGKKGVGGLAPATPAMSGRVTDTAQSGAAPSTLDLPALSPAVRLGKRVIRVVEAALDAVHRPLARISPNLLPVIGVCALTTIGVSTLSIVALPILFPSRDAISYLDERIAALDAPKVEKPKPDASEHGAEKPKKDAADGHGDGKAKPKTEGDGHGESKPKKKEGDGHGTAAKSTTPKSATSVKSGGAKKADAGHE